MTNERRRVVYKEYVGYGRVEEVDTDNIPVRRESKSELVVLTLDQKKDIAWM